MSPRFLLLALLFPLVSHAASGGIDPSHSYAWSENLGWVQFSAAHGNVTVTDAEVTGYAWSETTGWINLHPSADAYVHNSPDGALSGYAWGEGIGYIDFNGVTIDAEGYFHGYAVSTTTGRISFNCDNTNTCGASSFKVRTYWRPEAGADPPAPASHTSSKKGSGLLPALTGFIGSLFPGAHENAPPISFCPEYLGRSINQGSSNDPGQVVRLQRFLNAYAGESIPETGVYGTDTIQAVNRFQEAHAALILAPDGRTVPTGNVRDATRGVINAMVCGENRAAHADPTAVPAPAAAAPAAAADAMPAVRSILPLIGAALSAGALLIFFSRYVWAWAARRKRRRRRIS